MLADKNNPRFLIKNCLAAGIFAVGLFGFSLQAYAAVYLDGSTTGCSNGSTNYSPATRTCGSGSDIVSITLADFNTRLAAGTTNYIRSGTYYRTSGTYAGALAITGKDGTSGSPTIIKAYTGEERQVIIGTAADKLQYPPSPGDISNGGALSYHYYPNPAISIESNWIVIDGLKTYGQIRFLGYSGGGEAHDNTVQNCDIGGGGPSDSQGNTVTWHTGYNYLVKNCTIHNGTAASDSDGNGIGMIVYHASGIVEQNTFYDNYFGDFFNKDTSGQTGRTTEVRYNFFTDSQYYAHNQAIRGGWQSMDILNEYFHHNVIINKGQAIDTQGSPVEQEIIYNNTIINSTERDITCGSTGTYYGYNNLFYHGSGSAIFSNVASNSYLGGSNYNVFYGAGSWTRLGSTYTSLANWQATGFDANSISGSNPNFVNSSGTTPADFKRSSYTENFTGSSYGIHAGAYETGSEQIGADWSAEADMISPAAPSGLSVS